MKSRERTFDEVEEENDWDAWDDDEVEDEIIDDDEDEDEPDAKEEEQDEEPQNRSEERTSKRKPSKKRERTKKAFVWMFRGIVVVLVLILLLAPGQPFETLRDETGIENLKDLMRPYMSFPEWVNVTMRIDYPVDISIRGPDGIVSEMEIHVASPFDMPQSENSQGGSYVIQDVLDVQFTPENNLDLSDHTKNDGSSNIGYNGDFNNEVNRITGWKVVDEIGPDLLFSVSYNLTLHTHKWEMDREDSGKISDIPQDLKDRYNGRNWMVDLNKDGEPDKDNEGNDLYRYDPEDPEIISIAEEITKDEDTVFGKVEAIYDYMQEEFTYTTAAQREDDREQYKDYPKWATGCLADGYGDCDDQSLLMASLCRAIGIPAWLEIGYLYDPLGDSWGGHGWFNVAIPYYTDNGELAERPAIVPIDPVNHEFLFRDPYRITDWVDDGSFINDPDKEEPIFNLDYYYNYFSVSRRGDTTVTIEPETRSVNYEEHGSIKRYYDNELDPGNLPGTQQQLDLPELSPLLVLVPVSLLIIAIPIRPLLSKRE